MNCFY